MCSGLSFITLILTGFMSKDFGRGLKWAGKEHRWEKRTNYAIIFALLVVCIVSYYDFYPGEVSIVSIVFIGIVHGIARFCHRMEQHHLKGTRPWRK